MTKPADKPWLFRTYSGHSSATDSNALYRSNLSKGQTGLSVAFDLPTQTGYDSDHELAQSEVGKVGVPVCHLGDIRTLFDGIPLDKMNTSMTINATAPWLLALYIALADERNIDRSSLRGTVQNDVIKEYLSRGTYICPPEPSLQMTIDVAEYCIRNIPNWNPTNVCSYHLQEAGATPEQEIAYALATAVAVLDGLKERVEEHEFPLAVGRISFFVNAGIRFVTEMCKMRAFTELWDEICRSRYGVERKELRRFRYGVQVNSLGLTEQQPENNVHRIMLEMLAVTLSRNARARAVQLPAWNEAMGLPTPWDQQWSLRMQQILACESDLLEFGDLFDGNPAVAEKVKAIKSDALNELRQVEELGGAIKSIEFMKRRLVESNGERIRRIESGETIIVGVNKYREGVRSPLESGRTSTLRVGPEVATEQIERLEAWRRDRNPHRVKNALDKLRQAAKAGVNILPASIDAAKAGVTTGEWGMVMRSEHGEFRAPTGISRAPSNTVGDLVEIRQAVDDASRKLGRRLKLLIGKPGLDGHSNGAEQIVCRARDCGIDIAYDGIRFTPEDIADAALQERAHVVGLSILSGTHLPLVGEFRRRMTERGLASVPLIVGGIIPEEDVKELRELGVAGVYTPKDFDINNIMMEIVRLASADAVAGEDCETTRTSKDSDVAQRRTQSVDV